ncbi:MAG: A/G-specific adenine glycosylase [Clostridia bacterium]|nr:A/G-specific adenine glycosylase [Clostridia bacterium]
MKLETALADSLLDWYDAVERPLPWRTEPTPYRVWVSEIMLQQTRIEAVLPYFSRFVEELPDIAALAEVPTDRLMKLWEGLGYYSRARNLKKAAQVLVDEYGGSMPANYDLILSLPGIGPYTAGAIASIAFGLPYPAVDGNVLRVMARLCDHHGDVMTPAVRRELTGIVGQWMPSEQPGRFNQAIMELGETLCLPNTIPRCGQCPLRKGCLGFARDTAATLPIRNNRTKRRVEQRTVLVCIARFPTPKVLLHKRPEEGLLAGLWELPNALSDELGTPERWATDRHIPLIDVTPLPAGKHLFSHIEWQMSGFALRTEPFTPPDGFVWADEHQLRGLYALPSAFRTYSQALAAWLHTNE